MGPTGSPGQWQIETDHPSQKTALHTAGRLSNLQSSSKDAPPKSGIQTSTKRWFKTDNVVHLLERGLCRWNQTHGHLRSVAGLQIFITVFDVIDWPLAPVVGRIFGNIVLMAVSLCVCITLKLGYYKSCYFSFSYLNLVNYFELNLTKLDTKHHKCPSPFDTDFPLF